MKNYKCTKCLKEKPVTKEHWKLYSRIKKDGSESFYRNSKMCRICVNEHRRSKKERDKANKVSKKWRDKNIELRRTKERQYRQKNAEEINRKRRKRYKENIHLRKKNSERVSIYRKNNIRYRINHNFSTSVRSYIKDKNGSKVFDLVGYSVEDLMKHLENLFSEGMSWDNYGKWHIDHIMPVSSFSFSSKNDPEFKKCWALSNLQPLWAIDNLRKNNRIL